MQKNITYIIEGGYQIQIPEGTKVKKKSPVEDFVIYEFSSPNNVFLLKLYIGNQPNTILATNDIKKCEGIESPFVYKCLSKASEEHVVGRLADAGWPQYAHFSYIKNNLNDDHFNKALIEGFIKQPSE